MPSDDRKDFQTSTIDFYELLGLGYEFSQKELDRSWRKTALKYHPDKCGPDEEAKKKFHLAQIGYDLLSDPSSKATYDNARTARLQKQRQNELFEGRRRQMKEDLEAGERGVKRRRDEDVDEEEKLEREIRRLAEDGKRRRKEREEALRRDMQESSDQKEMSREAHPAGVSNGHANPTDKPGVTENDRTVKIRISKKKDNGTLTEDRLRTLFSDFGDIETVDVLPSSTEKKRKTATVQFASIVGAHASVIGFQSGKLAKWKMIESVDWLTGQEPHYLSRNEKVSKQSPPYQPENPTLGANPSSRNGFSTSTSSIPHNIIPSDKKPSFASFSAAGLDQAKTSSPGINSPTLEEMTLIRLRKLEQKALAAEIERSDREADANG
ncbi:MAG: hypothetical protein OHK93_008619 [Ramalina farinacea]|uniref:J domain-containing protein n=1 Tax=Ramalina farinacea TaxID=258253 RepID=A0AA43QQN3_9LECA|nr:hypothetical protein [Ramalina farinacea]